MRRPALLALLTLLAPVAARAAGGTYDNGNVAIIDDADTGGHLIGACNLNTDGGTPCPPDYYCREAAKVFYQTHCDDYDALVVFLDNTVSGIGGAISDTEQGTPVQQHLKGIGRDLSYDWTAGYGSAGRLEQCVSMTSLSTKPDNPDDPVIGVLGLPLPLGITGIELLGHEFGHHWLQGATFDLGAAGGNLGPEDLLRGCESSNNSGGGTSTCDPNQHYAAYTNSHSVMYGNFVTDNGDGTYTVCGGTPRGYNQLDQYLMGLLPASQVQDPIIWTLDDGTHHGDPAGALSPGASNCITVPQSGSSTTYTRVDVTLADLVRAMGPRSGPAAETPTNWNVGFILVTPSGVTPSQADLDKVNAYRTRFEQWFTTATGGRGAVHTELVPNDCTLPPPVTDGGTPDSGPPPVVDAGTLDAGPPPVVDAGTPDAGPVLDAGTPDAGPPDAGPGVDAGTPDAGGRGCGVIPCDDGGTPDAGTHLGTLATTGCGCAASSASGTVIPAVALLLLLGLRRRRRA